MRPRTARIAPRFVQQNHGKTAKLLRAKADEKRGSWFYYDGWLEVGVVREAVLSMLQPLVWRQSAQQPPADVWGWKGMYIQEDEVDQILKSTLRGFFAVNPTEIVKAEHKAFDDRNSNLHKRLVGFVYGLTCTKP